MFLLDTCIISELVKKDPFLPLINWMKEESEYHFFLSVVTLGEIEKGIARLENSAKKSNLLSWLHGDVQERFQGRIFPIDEKVVKVWGRLLGEAECKGKKIPVIDGFIAATCLVHDLTLVTRNVKDFEGLPVIVMNPWI